MTSKRIRGERAGLTRDQIIDATLELVDGGGLSALTMRRLATEMGVEAMTLYHYFPNKAALVDGIVERMFTTIPPVAENADWCLYLRGYAGALRETLLRHPGVLPVIVRPAVTPATLDSVEGALQKLTRAGFPLGRAVDALNALTLFVIGHTAAEAAIGPSDDAASVHDLDAQRHPLLTAAVKTGAGVDDLERFHFAVDALLTGFAETLRPQSSC